ncbi:ATP-binding protein [Streptomyces sp. Act143]|uniref:ATP-binding protein n=1 Tax=Streptomyces sp. Act143 TaxID=2200760 RepID=UPI001C63AF33|nr:ATP-binding protein [Streptomyces sp. Act143]
MSETPLSDRSWKGRLSRARERAFVGRVRELQRFEAALGGDEEGPLAFYLYGAGGIGKSALVRRMGDLAADAGRQVVQLDGRFVDRDPAAFERAAAPFVAVPGTVLLLDSFEHCQWLEDWLWQRFLPRAADGALAVVAGRFAPQPQWMADPAWSGLLAVRELDVLSEREALDLLAAAAVRPERLNQVLRFAGGNPLALTLGAADAAAGSTSADGTPSADVLRTLLAGLIGEVPTPAHRRALEVAAQAPCTSEELLAAVLADEDVGDLFTWLRDLPFMESAAAGLYPHDAARGTLMADLRWRAPNAFSAMRHRLAEEYLRLLREAPEERVRAITDELFYLFQDVEVLARLRVRPTIDNEVHESVLDPADHALVLGMAEETEGPESAELVRFWLARQPERFSVYRLISTGRIVAFTAHLVLPYPPDETEVARDPVVAAAWQYGERTSPVRDGEHIAVTRFSIYPELYQVRSRVVDLANSRVQAEAARARGRTHGFLVYHDHEAWAEQLRGVLADSGERPVVGGRTYGLFTIDWRKIPVESWLRHLINATEMPALSGPSGVSRTVFEQGVREALRHWRSPSVFGSCALLRSRLVADSAEPVEDLRTLLRDAVEAVAANPHGARARDVLATTYFSGAPTQEAAARRLSLPFGTYRRHLRQGLDLLCEALWQREMYGPH